MVLYLILAIIGLMIIIIVIYFNLFVRYRNRIRNAWSDIDVQLKRRFELIPNLVEVVKGYASHERKLFEEIAHTRSLASGAGEPAEYASASNLMTAHLKSLFAVVENYPILLANENFIKLQDKLVEIEENIQMARRYYNALVRDNNTAVESFPGLIFARLFGFRSSPFFEIDELEKDVIKIRLQEN